MRTKIAVAHTAPVYFRNGDQPLPVPRDDAEYQLGNLDALIRDAETGTEQRSETVRVFREARTSMPLKLRQAN